MHVLLVDDHPVVRRGLRQILGEERNTIGEASDAASALDAIRGGAWDFVLCDLSLPGMSGLDLVKQLGRERPALPVVVLSVHPPSQFAQRALHAGARGYVQKDAAPEELLRAIAAVRRGQRYVSSGSGAEWWPSGSIRLPHDTLSDREYQVLRQLGSGRTVSEVAADFALSVKTVSTYRARVLQKLGMRTSAELMRYAIENGLIDS